jgi:outer membrane protein assembly factor BamB
MRARTALAIVLTALSYVPLRSAPDAVWPGFRGPNAAGVADGEKLPDTWNVGTGQNIAWKAEIPGLAHSSPIVWRDRVFVATAISSRTDATFKPGLYGEGTASEDRSPHKWVVLALDAKSGREVWRTVALEGQPREKRHIKSTYASQTPATDGRYVVAFFGSQGLYAFDMKGKLAWKKDFGHLDAGAYDLPEYEWGNASSPTIYKDLVIVQCDTQKASFVAAFDIRTGEQKWKADRKELPSWGTPTVIVPPSGRPELVTNASNYIRGYDPETGKELWRLGGSSKITAPTPIFASNMIIVASGRGPERPIFAIRPGATGDITLADGQESNAFVAWHKTGRGSYMPTPIAYDGTLYVLANAGLLDAYDVGTGAEIYRQRLPHKGSGFSASPVASDGRLFLSSEDGEMFVVRAGPKFEIVATNAMGEPLMATPAIASGTMYVRGEKHLFAVKGQGSRVKGQGSRR